MTDPLYRAQGMIMIHNGKVFYESYPGMKPTDRHLTASTGKVTVGLVLALLVDEGRVDLSKPITDYVPQMKDYVWDEITTYSVANMTTGPSNEETIQSILNPTSEVTRFIGAISGSVDPVAGKSVDGIEIARLTSKLDGEKQGDISPGLQPAPMIQFVYTASSQDIEGCWLSHKKQEEYLCVTS